MKFDRSKLDSARRGRRRHARSYSFGTPSIAGGATVDSRYVKPRELPAADDRSIQTGSTTANFSG